MDLTEFDNLDSSIDHFALNMLVRVISLEERRTRRMSCLSVFCRLDVSVYRKKTGEHKYFVNEITRTHGTALFPQWDSNNSLDLLFTHMANTLHYVCSRRLYLNPPTSF